MITYKSLKLKEPYYMEDGEEANITVGEIYPVTMQTVDSICITDDKGTSHGFPIDVAEDVKDLELHFDITSEIYYPCHIRVVRNDIIYFVPDRCKGELTVELSTCDLYKISSIVVKGQKIHKIRWDLEDFFSQVLCNEESS